MPWTEVAQLRGAKPSALVPARQVQPALGSCRAILRCTRPLAPGPAGASSHVGARYPRDARK